MTDIRPLSCAIATLFPAIQMWLSSPDAAESKPNLPAGEINDSECNLRLAL